MTLSSLSEKDPARQLAEYRREHAEQARRMLLSVDELSSGVSRQVAATTDVHQQLDVANDLLGRFVAAQGEQTDVLARALGTMSAQLDHVAAALVNPAATQANEQRAWGERALDEHRYREAAASLRAATSLNPHDSLAHFGLARALHGVRTRPPALGEPALPPDGLPGPTEAAEHAARAAGQSARAHPAFATTAVLLSVDCYRAAGSEQEADEVLAAFVREVPHCAVAWLALARSRDDAGHLARAVSLDPTTIVDAELARLPHVEAAACAAGEEWRPRFEAGQAAAAQLGDIAAEVGLADPFPPMPHAPTAAAALLARYLWLVQLNRELPAALARVRAAVAAATPELVALPSPPPEPTRPSDPPVDARAETYQRRAATRRAWLVVTAVVAVTGYSTGIALSGVGGGGLWVSVMWATFFISSVLMVVVSKTKPSDEQREAWERSEAAAARHRRAMGDYEAELARYRSARRTYEQALAETDARNEPLADRRAHLLDLDRRLTTFWDRHPRPNAPAVVRPLLPQ